MPKATNLWIRRSGPSVLALALALAGAARGAVFYTETFSSSGTVGGPSGWVDRDPGKMVDSWNSGFGHPAGSDQGTFAAQVFSLPQTDAWEANSTSSGGSFTGDYWVDTVGFTGFRLDFYAANVLPSDATLRFGDGTHVFSYSLGSQITAPGQWNQIGVTLNYALGGWFGGTAAQFSNTLHSVTFVDVQVSRNGRGAQTYYLDNFGLSNSLIFVPEPTSGLFWFGWALVFGGLRRKLAARRERSPYALPTDGK